MAFGNSYNDSSFTKGQQAAKAAPPPQAPEGAQGAVQQSATPGQTSSAAQEAPGFDLVDGIASVLFAPGRAIVGQFHPPTMKDLPLIIGLSAAFYWAAWWAYERWVAPQFGDSDEKPTRVRIKRLKPRRVVEEEDDDAE